MGTRSRIGYVNPESGKILSAYCHWDGYPSNNGKILLEHYATLDRVRLLVSEGDMSSLEPECTKPEGHTFDKPVDGFTTYYGRDRGESGVEPQFSKTKEAFLKLTDETGGEYAYLFDDGKWFFTDLYDGPNLRPLTKKDCEK